MEIQAWFDSNIGLVRKSNQDTVGCYPEIALFIVADGMGGHADGEVASRLATDVIRGHFSSPPSPDPAPRPALLSRFFPFGRRRVPQPGAESEGARLQAAIEEANRRVFEEGRTRAQGRQIAMGTTVVALRCALVQRRAYWAYVGDSRLYRARNGHLTLLTADHTLYGEPYREEAEIPSDLPHTNRLVRAVGIQPDVEVSTGSDALVAGDLFLLCSDGVSGMIGAQEIEAEMTSGRSLHEIGSALIERALRAGGKDNASALLVKVSPAASTA